MANPYQKTFNVPEEVKEKYIDLWLNQEVFRFLNSGETTYPRPTSSEPSRLDRLGPRTYRLTYLSGIKAEIPLGLDIGLGGTTFAEVANAPTTPSPVAVAVAQDTKKIKGN